MMSSSAPSVRRRSSRIATLMTYFHGHEDEELESDSSSYAHDSDIDELQSNSEELSESSGWETISGDVSSSSESKLATPMLPKFAAAAASSSRSVPTDTPPFEPRIPRSKRPAPRDELSTLPLEIILKSMAFLPAQSLVTLSGVSLLFWELAHDESLWKVLCFAEWSNKKHRPRLLFQNYHYRGPLLRRLNAADCESILVQRGIEFEPDLSDDEKRAMVERTAPSHAVKHYCASKWKASLFAARIDSKRKRITKKELMDVTWLYIDMGWGYYNDSDQDPDPPLVKFFPNKTRGPIDGGPRPRICDWYLRKDGGIQVSHFQTHHTSRTDDWGWEFSNPWVTYRST
eukprot:jgi/Hompol1/6036/HPOL_004832-RA